MLQLCPFFFSSLTLTEVLPEGHLMLFVPFFGGFSVRGESVLGLALGAPGHCGLLKVLQEG